MSKKIIIENFGKGHAIVVLEQDRLIDFFLDPPKKATFYPPGILLSAKIERRISSIGGYFVKLPNGQEGFLKSKRQYQEGIKINLLSKVFYDPSKLQMFTDKIKRVSKYFIIKSGKSGFSYSKKLSKDFKKNQLSSHMNCVLKKNEDVFVIFRSCIVNLSFDEIQAELEIHLCEFKKTLNSIKMNNECLIVSAKRALQEKFDLRKHTVIEENGIFDRLGIWDKLYKLKENKIYFQNGSYLIVEQTSSFCTIDVNSGSNYKTSARDLNLKACEEISSMITLLGIGGKIIIDFLPSPFSSKREILSKLRKSLEIDTAKSTIWGWTKSGAFEIERERTKTPIKLVLND